MKSGPCKLRKGNVQAHRYANHTPLCVENKGVNGGNEAGSEGHLLVDGTSALVFWSGSGTQSYPPGTRMEIVRFRCSLGCANLTRSFP